MRDNHSPTNTEPESAHDHVDEHIVQDQWAHGKIAKSPPTTRAGAVVDPPPAAEPATFSNAAEPGVVEPAAIAGFEMTGAHLGDETAALTVAIVLPTKENMEIMLPLLATDSVQDIRYFVAERPEAYMYTSYYFEFNGMRLNDMVEVGSITGMAAGGKLHMRTDDYNDRAVRIHVRRLQDLLRPADESFERLGSVKPASDFYAPSYLNSVLSAPDPPQGQPGGVPACLPASSSENVLQLQDVYGVPAPSQPAPQQCVANLSYSGWNPPPGNRVFKGDVAYLRIKTATGTVAHVTASTKGFYVSRTTDDTFAPQESSTRPCRANTLVGTLSLLCPVFRARFGNMLRTTDDKAKQELLPTPRRVRSWMVTRKVHELDQMRAEDAAANWSETDPLNPGMIRDWNEDLQASRELPQADAASKLFRDRVLFKFNLDYVAAAVTGVRATVLGNIPPMNPADEPASHMFIWNSMLLSFASNSRGNYTILGGEEAAHVAANNDLKGVRTFSDLGPCGLSTLATVVVDYLGRRVIAQSIIPGILRKDQNSAIVYGANEEEKTMEIDPRFNVPLKSLSKRLRTKEHSIRYLDGNDYLINSSAETKGIAGTDGRLYLLDLTRTTPVDVNFAAAEHRDGARAPYFQLYGAEAAAAAEWVPRHGLYLLRKELIDLFCAKKLGAPAAPGTADAAATDAADATDVEFNLDVYTNIAAVAPPAVLAQDKALVTEAGDFLLQTVIPNFVLNLAAMRQSVIDGHALSLMMHARGINMRYLGCVASQLADVGMPQVQPIVRICVIEMLARALKHQLRAVMRTTDVAQMADVIANFLNCAAFIQSAGGKKRKGKHKKAGGGGSGGEQQITPAKLWDSVVNICATHFRVLLVVSNGAGEHSGSVQVGASADGVQISKLALLRSLCQKTGVQLLARQYNLGSKVAGSTTFTADDIVDVLPMSKHMAPASVEGKALYDAGCLRSQAGMMREAADLLERALQSMQQTYGLMHEGIADCYRQLAVIFFKTEQYEFAVSYQKKALLTSEGVRGRDHPETIRDCIHLGQYLRLNEQREKALLVLRHARNLCTIAAGESHQEHALLDTHIALCHLELRDPRRAISWLDRALACQTELFTEADAQCAQTNVIKAKALVHGDDVRAALECARSAHGVYAAKLGRGHRKTQETYALVQQLVKDAVRESTMQIQKASPATK